MKKELLMILSICSLLFGCQSIPSGLKPVQNFELERYLGTWYEIVRLDHRFEKGLDNVSATYTLRRDGGVKVVNKGYNAQQGLWKEAVGKAYFRGKSDVGALKVSFFGPFYGGYNIIDLDHEKYSYAVVCGPTRNYFWILARRPDMSKTRRQELLSKAQKFGFETAELIIVKHDTQPAPESEP